VAHLVGEMYVQQHQPIEQNLIEDFDVPKEARSVSVSLDRVSVPMEEPRDGHEQEEEEAETGDGATKRRIEVVYRMAYCATVTLHARLPPAGPRRALRDERASDIHAGDRAYLA